MCTTYWEIGTHFHMRAWDVTLNGVIAYREALDFHPHASRIGEHRQLLQPHPDGFDPRIGETQMSDFLGQCFNQIDMPAAHQRTHAIGDLFVTDNVYKVIAEVGALAHGKIEIDPHRLLGLFFMPMDADETLQHEVADEDMADGVARVGDVQGRDNAGGLGRHGTGFSVGRDFPDVASL